MKDTRIRWSEHSWNPTVGCTVITEGCENCYAEEITKRWPGSFANGFTPTYKANKLTEPGKWFRKTGAARVFVNSMSDLHHVDFTDEQRDSIYDVMLQAPHDYLVLTKRPQEMRRYFTGPDGWLARRDLDVVPANIWLGTSIELDKYCKLRTRHLTAIPAVVHFLSLEPLLGPLPSLPLDNIQWVIVGGESGRGFRPMDHQWARDLRDQANKSDVAFFFKQSAAIRTEMGMTLDGELHEEYPLEHPADRARFGHGAVVGRWSGRHPLHLTGDGTAQGSLM